jgi:hypothetical protein
MRIAIANLLTLPGRRKTAVDVQEELQFHLDMLERKYTEHGMPATQAKAAALRRFGNLERIKQQCVDISRRNSLLRRVLKTSAILLGLAGLSIHFLASDYKVVRIGHVLIMIAISGRLLLYVRGLMPSTFSPQTNERSLSIITGTLERGAQS